MSKHFQSQTHVLIQTPSSKFEGGLRSQRSSNETLGCFWRQPRGGSATEMERKSAASSADLHTNTRVAKLCEARARGGSVERRNQELSAGWAGARTRPPRPRRRP